MFTAPVLSLVAIVLATKTGKSKKGRAEHLYLIRLQAYKQKLIQSPYFTLRLMTVMKVYVTV